MLKTGSHQRHTDFQNRKQLPILMLDKAQAHKLHSKCSNVPSSPRISETFFLSSLVIRRYRYKYSSSSASQWLSFSEQLEESVFLTEVHRATLVTGGQALLFLHSTTDSLTFAFCIWIFRLDVHRDVEMLQELNCKCCLWSWYAFQSTSRYIFTLMIYWLIYKEMLTNI